MTITHKLATVVFLCFCSLVPKALAETHYGAGDVLDPDIFIADEQGQPVLLNSLLGANDALINVLFIFGGGDMGAGLPGHLWCQDSFEDTHILRTLYEKYQDKGVNFIPVAAAPVYHTNMLGHPARIFLDGSAKDEAYREAESAFVDSTMASFDDSILPVKPWFDPGFRLMWNRAMDITPGEQYGEVHDWQGSFRSADETQFYGVPGFWIISNEGEVMQEPLRGNIYHPHGGEVTIRYTLSDVDTVIARALH